MKRVAENYLVVFFDSFADYMARLDPSERIFARSSPVDHLLY